MVSGGAVIGAHMSGIWQELEKIGSAYMENFNRRDAAGICLGRYADKQG
jgi:hypothetical protein